MKKLLIALTLLLSSIMPAMAWDNTARNMQVDQTNFLVNDNCSGTLIDKSQGLVLTANHCITDQFVEVEREEVQPDGTLKKMKRRVAKTGTVSQLSFNGVNEISRTSYVFKIVGNDRELDLALLKVQAKLPNTLESTLACGETSRGDAVAAVGNPYAVLYSTITRGYVSSVQRNYKMIGVEDQGDHGLIQHTAPIAGGNSGGALYNDAGALVGVNVRNTATGLVGLAVPLEDVKKFIADTKIANLPTCQ